MEDDVYQLIVPLYELLLLENEIVFFSISNTFIKASDDFIDMVIVTTIK